MKPIPKDQWEECPNCENMTKFMKTGYCIDCNKIIIDGNPIIGVDFAKEGTESFIPSSLTEEE